MAPRKVAESLDVGPRMELAAVLKALADPVRLHIVRLADSGERGCNQFDLDIPKATLSHHFSVLRLAGIVEARPQGTRHLVILRKRQLEAQFPGLLKSVLKAAEQMPPCPKAVQSTPG